MGQDRNPREHVSRSGYHWDQERTSLDTASDESRCAETYDMRRGPPMGIEQALQEHCNLPGKFYFVVVVGHDGKPTLFTAPNYPTVDAKKFVNLEGLSAEINQAMSVKNPLGGPYDDSDFGFAAGMGRSSGDMTRRWNQSLRYGQSVKSEAFDNDDGYKIRKRNRRPDLARDELADAGPVPTSSSTSVRKSLRIGDETALWDFYDQRFKDCQQTACKLIAKAWVKAVEPKKQSTFPYTGSDDKAPGWWPKPWGKTKEEKVRHKEPDHLLKRERVHLLVHILKLVVEPSHKQHEAISSAKLNVDRLEWITEEALSAFFNDNELPGNAKKRPFLKELFKVARKEEAYKDGGIDASTTIYVSNNDQVGLDLSDTDEYSPSRDEEENIDASALPSSATSQREIATTTQTIIPSHPADAVSHMPHGGYVGEMTTRPPFLPQLMPPTALGSDRTAFEGPALASPGSFHPGTLGMPDMYASPHDSSRRSSLFQQTPEYTSPTTPMYASWPPGSTAPTSQSLYYTTQAAGSNAPFASQSASGVGSSHHYYGNPFDGLPRAPEEANAGGVFRPNSVGSVPLGHHTSYYMGHDPATMAGPSKLTH